jgi:hypothetical protein
VKAFLLPSFRAGLSNKKRSRLSLEQKRKISQMQNTVVRQTIRAFAVIGALAFAQFSHAQFATSVVSYNSGVGFQASYTTPTSALGEPSRVTPGLYGGPVDPFNSAYLSSQVVSIGAGGSITLQFATPILNNPANAFGRDFNIFGNAGFIITNEYDVNVFDWVGTPATDSSLYGADAISTRVSVSIDGVNFFTLNPSLAPTLDSYFPTDGIGDFGLPVNPSLTPSSFAGLNLAQIRALYNGSGGGASYDISWAQDGLGQSVALGSIEYIRIEVLGGNAEIDGIVAVPEPTALALAMLGVGAIALARRKQI